MPASTRSQLLEREAALSRLRATIDAARAGAGQTALVEAAAGVGKSALLAHASAVASDQGVLVLRANASELERDFPFAVVRQFFAPVLVAAAPRERGRLLAGAAAPAEWVVGPASDLEDPRTRAEAGLAVLNAIYWLVAALAARTPLMLCVDDLHWVDEPSLRALAYLSRRVSDLPVALVGALRPSEPGSPAALLDELREAPGAARIAPAALGAESVAALVRAEVPRAADDLCDACYEASAGNPLYLRELLLAVSARGIGDGSAAAAQIRRASVPTLGERLMRRIAQVAPRAESLANAMAVLESGSLAVAASLAGIEAGAAARIARRLVEVEVLSNDAPFAFAHPVLRRTLYDRLSATEREAAHLAAGDLLRAAGASSDVLAAHLGALTPAGSTGVATALAEAARQALSRAAPDAAIRFLRRALEEGADTPERPRLLLELGKAEMAVRDPAAIAHLREAFEAAGDPDMRAEVAVPLTEILNAAGQWEASIDVIRRATTECSDPELEAELETYLAVTRAYDSRLVEEFERDRDRLAELSQGESWAAHALAALLACTAAFRCEGTDAVNRHADRALAGGRLIRERGGGGWAAAQILGALVITEQSERALAVCDEVAAQGRRTGSLIGQVTGAGYRGFVFNRHGDLASAEAELRNVLDICIESGMTLWTASAFHLFGDAILERPQLADVAELADTLEMDPIVLSTAIGAMVLELRGRMGLARGDRRRAIDDLELAAESNRLMGMGPTYTACRSSLALAVAPDDPERARRLVAEELELARASGLARPEGIALRTAGLLEGGEAGVEHLRESVAKLASSGARLEHARSLVELGAALGPRGQRGAGLDGTKSLAAAREHLEAGMDLAHRCGAETLARRAREELVAAGARPRRLATSGPEALTASERRVATMAADGMANREIAQALFVTVRTVEGHLSNAFAKLEIASRDELGAALSSQG